MEYVDEASRLDKTILWFVVLILFLLISTKGMVNGSSLRRNGCDEKYTVDNVGLRLFQTTTASLLVISVAITLWGGLKARKYHNQTLSMAKTKIRPITNFLGSLINIYIQ